MSAFGPGASVPEDEGYPLYYDFPALTTDGDGELSTDLTLPPGSPAGHYGLWVDPARVSGCPNTQPCWDFKVPIR
ncbi:hypothetical protein E0H73_45480 [Kribbella pittospori]|uniref:Uncharacterized protein n=1 Tax=Kribbella pittospori TaxID=722689 RepID=A0A4R0JRT5_9ACTN|nr:hypothetical protein [Kribbella pittospori]TCC44775.1 hypothetical protein E0H73_45480 [Kribbella pittospori]